MTLAANLTAGTIVNGIRIVNVVDAAAAKYDTEKVADLTFSDSSSPIVAGQEYGAGESFIIRTPAAGDFEDVTGATVPNGALVEVVFPAGGTAPADPATITPAEFAQMELVGGVGGSEPVTMHAPAHGLNAATLAAQGLARGVYEAGTVRLATPLEDHDVIILGAVDDDTLSIALPYHTYRMSSIAPVLDTLGTQTLLYRSDSTDGAWSQAIDGGPIARYLGDEMVMVLESPSGGIGNDLPGPTLIELHNEEFSGQLFNTNTTRTFGDFTGSDVLHFEISNASDAFTTPCGPFEVAELVAKVGAFNGFAAGYLSTHALTFGLTSADLSDLSIRGSCTPTGGLLITRIIGYQRIQQRKVQTDALVQFEAGLSDGDLLKLDTTTTPWTLRQETVGGVAGIHASSNQAGAVRFHDFYFACTSGGNRSMRMRTVTGTHQLSVNDSWWNNGGHYNLQSAYTLGTGWSYVNSAWTFGNHNMLQVVTFIANGWLYWVKMVIGPGYNANRWTCYRWRL